MIDSGATWSAHQPASSPRSSVSLRRHWSLVGCSYHHTDPSIRVHTVITLEADLVALVCRHDLISPLLICQCRALFSVDLLAPIKRTVFCSNGHGGLLNCCRILVVLSRSPLVAGPFDFFSVCQSTWIHLCFSVRHTQAASAHNPLSQSSRISYDVVSIRESSRYPAVWCIGQCGARRDEDTDSVALFLLLLVESATSISFNSVNHTPPGQWRYAKAHKCHS